MNKKDPKLTVLQFNECINNQDSDGLENFLTQDTKMIQGEEITHVGKDTLKKIWIQFFKMCPDYKNHFIRIESQENLVIIIGYSTCSTKALDGPVLWTAKIENDLVAEWRILDDSKENRKLLGILI